MGNLQNEGRRPGRPTREEAEAIAEAVLVGAREVFCQQGFAGAGMDEIAAAVGVSKLTIYRRYPSKEALLVAAVDHHLADLTAKVDATSERGLPPMEALRQTARTLFDASVAAESIRFARLLIGESIHNETLCARFSDWERMARAPLRERIVAAQRAGVLREGDPGVLTSILGELLEGLAKRLRHNKDEISAGSAASFFDQRWQFFERAVRPD